MMGHFHQIAQEKRLATGLIYYSWLGEARYDVYRCGARSQNGATRSCRYRPIDGGSTARC